MRSGLGAGVDHLQHATLSLHAQTGTSRQIDDIRAALLRLLRPIVSARGLTAEPRGLPLPRDHTIIA